jgi:hypothetical protein
MASNPFQCKQYEKALEDYIKAVRIATFYRESFLPNTVSQRILEKEGLSLSRSDCYNLHREKALKGVQDEFEALVHILDEAGFKFAYGMELKRNQANKIIGRQLQQI